MSKSFWYAFLGAQAQESVSPSPYLEFDIYPSIALHRHNRNAVDSQTRNSITLTSSEPGQTQAIGRLLGEYAQAGDVFLLSGELGAGKTCLTQGILWGLGGDEYARSPTFVLICEYPARHRLYHMDLYRLDGLDEIIDLGLDDYFLGDGVCVVEWAEKGVDAFIGEHVNVLIEDTGSESRRLTFVADAPRYAEMLGALKEHAADSANTRQSQSASDEAH